MVKGAQGCERKARACKASVDLIEYAAWAKNVWECERHYQVDSKFGLSDGEVEKRVQKYGLNELEKHKRQSIFHLVLDQFNDTFVRISLAAAVISFVLSWYAGEEGVGMDMEIAAFIEFAVLIVNVIIGVWQETSVEKALEALKDTQLQQVTVIRNGRKIYCFPANNLVPGDIVELRVGDKVPADMRVIKLISSTLRVEQGSLTGESEALNKTTKPVPQESDIQGKKCMVFAGTTVVNGNCICIVTEIGKNTEIGKVHSQIHEASLNEVDTPLKKKLNKFTQVLSMLTGLICLLVWLINMKYFLSWEYVDGWPKSFEFSFKNCISYFEFVVAFAVAAIPEGLPAVVTTCLALGTLKMTQKNALVRKLPSVETLGSTTVICSDKTGTLTTNQMAVVKLVAMGHGANDVRSFIVEGTTYDPLDGKIKDWPAGRMDANLQTIAKIAALANNAGIERSEKGYVATGMPTEAALKVLVEKMGLPAGLRSGSSTGYGDLLVCSREWSKVERRIAILEFDRDRKSMGVIVVSRSGRKSLLVKGAVESLLERSSHIQLLDGSIVELDKRAKKVIVCNLKELSSAALRVLGFAYKEDPPEFMTYNGNENHPAHKFLLDPANYSSIESNLIFAGLAGLRDPPRKEVPQAIEDCRIAGIQVIVVTGDNKNTAEAICREIGVFGQEEDISSRSLTGREFMDLDNHDQKCHLAYKEGLLFSRAEPRHKQLIVRLLKNAGEVVAMTGDGVNDAPALNLADIGIAMGIAGTEVFMQVAKEASDMVLADDNFSTIVAAIAEGRSIHNNMKSFIRYMISSNIGEVVFLFLTAAKGIPVGLIPVQLLFINLVTNVLPATALGFNVPDKYIMKKAPRRSQDSLIGAWILFRYLIIGLCIGMATLGVFIIWYTHDSFCGIDLSQDGHTLVTYSQLANWGHCSSWKNFSVSPFIAGDLLFNFHANPCDYFQSGKVKALTLSHSVFITMEMLNSLNALSEDESLMTVPPWVNPWLLLAMSVSFGLHFLILHVPFLSQVFGIVPLSINEWLLVLTVAFPVLLIDEILKLVSRLTNGSQTRPGYLKQRME